MPEIAEMPAAAAPPPASVPPPSPTHVNLTEPSQTAATPPKPGSARERMHQNAEKLFKQDEPPARTADKPPEPAPKKPEAPRPGDEPAGEKADVPPDVTPDQKKSGKPTLLDNFKLGQKRIKELESELSTVKSTSLAETEKSEFLERIQKAEAKVKEYESEIRFKSYEKSDEFKTKYEQPYEQAWSKHMGDLREVPVLSEDGSQHLATAEDMLTLVNASLPEARKLATEKWGDFANDAMTARKEIRALYESKNTALEEARKTGADREKQFQENAAKWRNDVQKHIKETWEAANQEALNHREMGEFLKPVEGDPKRNELLTKGFSRVDEAFALNPMDPKLTPEQRAKGVRLHAYVRNTSASSLVLKLINKRQALEIAELKKANGEFKGSEPPRAGGTTTPGTPATTRARDRMYAAQERFAK